MFISRSGSCTLQYVRVCLCTIFVFAFVAHKVFVYVPGHTQALPYALICVKYIFTQWCLSETFKMTICVSLIWRQKFVLQFSYVLCVPPCFHMELYDFHLKNVAFNILARMGKTSFLANACLDSMLWCCRSRWLRG